MSSFKHKDKRQDRGKAGLVIREEAPGDIPPLRDLVTAAFGRADEADLLDLLRADGDLLLSHVALLDGALVGQAAYSPISVRDGKREWSFVALGPIAVAPAHQRQGIGGALLGAGMAALREAGHGLLFLVGHVSYYPRFGFRPALPLGFSTDYFGPEDAHEPFMVAELAERLIGSARGHVKFARAFDEV